MLAYFQQFLGAINSVSAVLIISSFIFLLASLLFYQKQQKLSVWFLFFCALLLGLGFTTIDAYIHLWDEQYHALVAKNMIDTPLTPRLYSEAPLAYNYEIWVANHVWLHKPPLSLWQMALSIKLFGANYLAVRLPSVLMHAMLVFVIFRMGRILYTEKVGYIAAIVFVFLNYPLELAAGLHTSEHIDVAFMFYITLSLWSWLEYNETKRQKWLVLMAVFSGAAILTKWLVGLLVYAGAGIIQVVFKKHRSSMTSWSSFFLALSITSLLVLPWHIYAYFSFPVEYTHEMAYNSAHLYSAIEQHEGGVLYYWDNLNVLYGNGDLIQWIVLFAMVSVPFFAKHRIHALFLMVVLLTPYLFFTVAATKMMSFCVIVSPLIIVVVTGFFSGLLSKLPKLKNTPYIRVLEGVFVIMIAIFLLRPKEAMMNHKLDTKESLLIKETYQDSQNAIQSFPFHSNKKYALSHANKLPEEKILWMFYKDNVIAYDHPFTLSEQQQLNNLGYTLKQIQWQGKKVFLLDY
jgi:4-amino-4-deoxy-L-arabinose transferase-like glycosyltransferase